MGRKKGQVFSAEFKTRIVLEWRGNLNTDKEKINNLKEHVVSYFYKTDEQSIDEIKTNPKDRAIVRGTIPKAKSKAGRPRKQ